jgi:hypothetical protein
MRRVGILLLALADVCLYLDTREVADKSVALPDNRFDEPGTLRIVAERTADFAYSRIDCGVVLDKHIGSPQVVAKAAALDEVASRLHQQDQHFHRQSLEFDRNTASPEHIRCDVQIERCESKRL